MDFFRHCPGCGRRFHIKLESKKLVSVDREPIPRIAHGVADLKSYRPGMPLTVQEGRPIILDIEDFQYTYKCGHCGHEWTERRTKEEKEESHLPAEPFPIRGRE